MNSKKLLPVLQNKIESLDNGSLTESRKVKLQTLIDYIQQKYDKGQTLALNFICTHNSRRSQFAQLWAQVFADFHDIPLKSYSGGVEVTTLHENTLKTIVEEGFLVDFEAGCNPEYSIQFSEKGEVLKMFSKLYDHPVNPATDFAAVMTCDHADENCPFVVGASKRISITYEDPKKYDGTPQQDMEYKNCSDLIARELKYVFSQINA